MLQARLGAQNNTPLLDFDIRIVFLFLFVIFVRDVRNFLDALCVRGQNCRFFTTCAHQRRVGNHNGVLSALAPLLGARLFQTLQANGEVERHTSLNDVLALRIQHEGHVSEFKTDASADVLGELGCQHRAVDTLGVRQRSLHRLVHGSASGAVDKRSQTSFLRG